MEIARVSENSFKVKTKDTSLIFNPEKAGEEIVLFTKKPQDYSQFSNQLVIDAPGEYEVSGVSIKVEKHAEGLIYELFEEGQKLVVLSSPKVISSGELEDTSAVVVFLDESAGSELSKITCDIIVAVGPKESLPEDSANIKNIDKLNLKKSEEYKGYIIHLSK